MFALEPLPDTWVYKVGPTDVGGAPLVRAPMLLVGTRTADWCSLVQMNGSCEWRTVCKALANLAQSLINVDIIAPKGIDKNILQNIPPQLC